MPDFRRHLIDTACRMGNLGLTRTNSGNVSVRCEENGQQGFLITPTGMSYDMLVPEDIVFMDFDGKAYGRCTPSSEWRFHRDLYLAHPDAKAILHAHSPFASSLSCLRRDIPPFHYMIARFGGSTLRCADYATFGTQTLSDHAIAALQDRRGCLLANHGMIVFGHNLTHALDLGIELETLCEQYWRACQMGEPVLLDDQEMAVVLEKFANYGQQKART